MTPPALGDPRSVLLLLPLIALRIPQPVDAAHAGQQAGWAVEISAPPRRPQLLPPPLPPKWDHDQAGQCRLGARRGPCLGERPAAAERAVEFVGVERLRIE